MTVLAVLACLMSAFPAVAQQQAGQPAAKPVPSIVQMKDIVEYDRAPAKETHHMMRLMLGKSKVVTTDQDVVSVVVDKPERLSAFISGPRNINVLGRQQSGVAHFVAKDKSGKVIMARYVFIGDRTVRYIRVRTTCDKGPDEPACGRKQFFFCPDQCYEMSVTPLPTVAAEKP